MMCDKFEDLLTSYADGELEPGQKDLVDRHVRACPGCAALLSALLSTDTSLAAFPEIEPSPRLREKLYAIPDRKKFRFSLNLLLRPALQPVLAAATVFLVVFSFYMLSPEKSRINKAIGRQFDWGYNQAEKLYAKAGSVTDSLGAYAESVFDSLKKINPLSKSEE